MRHVPRLTIIATVLACALLLTACGNGAGAAAETPTADERPVPEGMPVMYEFFTES